ncbi:unnamed protein product, partial [marine sediment metagenome]
ENLDMAIWDLRTANRLFASPTPVVTCKAQKDAKAVEAYMNDPTRRWKIGKLLIIANAEYELKGLDSRGWEAIRAEVEMLAKAISGTSNVPVHFLGMPDLLSNRATADNLMELVTAGSSHARNTWIEFYSEMFEKVLEAANEKFKRGFEYTDGVGCDIPEISEGKLRQLASIWLPLYQAGVVSLETLLGMIPNVDPEIEKKRLEAAETLLAGLQDGGIEPIPRSLSDRDGVLKEGGEVVE